MNILIVANSRWNLDHFRSDLIKEIRAEGHEVWTAAPADHSKREDQYHIPLSNWAATGKNPWREVLAIRALYKAIKQVKPHLILSFTIKPNIYTSLLANTLSIPNIAVVTGMGTVFLGGGFRHQLVQSLFGLAMRRARQIVVQNPDDEQSLSARFRIKPSKISLIPGSGINLQHYQIAAIPNTEPFRFIYLGRRLANKGLHELVAAAKLLAKKGLDFEVQLIGDAAKDHPDRISLLVQNQWNDLPYISLQNPVEDIRPYLSAGHILILPSYREGLSRSLLEAMAMARPVITSDVAGCRQLVPEGQNGWLVPARSIEELAVAMETAIHTEPADLNKMGLAGRSLVETQFSLDIINKTYLNLIEKMLQ